MVRHQRGVDPLRAPLPDADDDACAAVHGPRTHPGAVLSVGASGPRIDWTIAERGRRLHARSSHSRRPPVEHDGRHLRTRSRDSCRCTLALYVYSQPGLITDGLSGQIGPLRGVRPQGSRRRHPVRRLRSSNTTRSRCRRSSLPRFMTSTATRLPVRLQADDDGSRSCRFSSRPAARWAAQVREDGNSFTEVRTITLTPLLLRHVFLDRCRPLANGAHGTHGRRLPLSPPRAPPPPVSSQASFAAQSLPASAILSCRRRKVLLDTRQKSRAPFGALPVFTFVYLAVFLSFFLAASFFELGLAPRPGLTQTSTPQALPG